MAYARKGGGRREWVGGQPPPPLKIEKNENLSFWNDPPYFKKVLPKLLSCLSVLFNLLNIVTRNFHCDAIIPVVEVFGALRLNQYDRLRE